MKRETLRQEVLEYQPDAVEIEETPVPGRVRWIFYLILVTIVAAVVWASLCKVDRIVSADGSLITTRPTIVVQPLHTSIVRAIEVQVGDVVEKNQLLATLDSTFARADLSQLRKQAVALKVQIRRIEAELAGSTFTARSGEGEDGLLQEQVFQQRKIIFLGNRRLNEEKTAALESRLAMNRVQSEGKRKQIRLLLDMEGVTARQPEKDNSYRLRLLAAQNERLQVRNELDRLEAEEKVVLHELAETRSEWARFVDERLGKLIEEKVQLRNELQKISEEINKAERLHELVSLRAPEKGIVLDLAKRSVGSIVQQAEPFITLVPAGSLMEAEVRVQPKDIARIRTGDSVRLKLDAFPFQRHDTLPGTVRVISEDAFEGGGQKIQDEKGNGGEIPPSFYRIRVKILSRKLRNVPEGFRLMPGMTVKAEIKVGRRAIISYFLYPIIRVFDESLREP